MLELTPSDASPEQQVLHILTAPPSKETLLALISWLDVACMADLADPFPQRVLARAVIAVGGVMTEKPAPVRRTLKAAEVYVREPTEENYDRFQAAATASYPFGPGDGCLAVAETGYVGCEVGSGCASGAGCLYLSPALEADVVMDAIARTVVPWLKRH